MPALVLAACGPRRLGYRILGAALVVGLFGYYPTARVLPRGLLSLAPNRGNDGTVEFSWHGLELIAGNYYVLTLLVFIAATACALVRTGKRNARRPGRPAAGPPGRLLSRVKRLPSHRDRRAGRAG
ncbi:MAG TPA: hypothetical protein VGM75_34690 [Pseudonocardiaceae bacterium]